MLPEEIQTVWSTFIQRPETLYKTRNIRFHDGNRQQLLDFLQFQNSTNILELGCGPGAFCFALKRWLHDSQITGLDRDTNFIEYARQKSVELDSACSFITGDAVNTGFPENNFDAVVSHTVIEHVETNSFLSEQFRVLKPGGICAVLSVRTSLSVNPESWKSGSEEEKALWDRVDPYFKAMDKKWGIAGYSISESELAGKMTETGFKDVAINFLVQKIIPDSSDVDSDTAIAIIETNRQIALDGIILANALAPGELSDAEIIRLRQLVNARFDKRRYLYEAGEKVWDISASVLVIARGYR